MDARTVFEILMQENADMLLAWLRATVRDPHLVEDLFQETLMVAWRRLDEFDRSRPFGPWLRGIAGNLVLAAQRQQTRSAIAVDAATLEWLEQRFARIQSLPGDTLQDKLEALRQCVEKLPDAYRLPVQLRYVESRGLPEIARSLELAMDSLKKRLVRARSRLADCLEQKLAALGEPS